MQELAADHEEADTRLILHVKHAAKDHKRVVVESPDTDVAILCIHFYSSVECEELWFETGTKDKHRFIPVHEVVSNIGSASCCALPGLHSLTGCDTTSALYGLGKKNALRALMSFSHHQGLSELGDHVTPSERMLQSCEQFICSMYQSDKHAATTTDEVRYWCFCQKNKRNEALPPTTNSLLLHIQRANYQALVWKRSLLQCQHLPSPTECGWKSNNGKMEAILMTKEPAPTSLIDLVACKCLKSKCKRRDLSQCQANGLSCTEACLCMGEEECCNTYKANMSGSDSEED